KKPCRPRGASWSLVRSDSCALISCRHARSGFCRSIQAVKPLRSAARRPFTLHVMMRTVGKSKIPRWARMAFHPNLLPPMNAVHEARPAREQFRREFVEFAILSGVLRFGEFRTKAGRLSPYFFNAGLFDDGEKLRELGRFYARAGLASGIAFDILFGPAYKGITLAAAMAIGLAENGHNVPFCFNRKEAKAHGEGGTIVGAPLSGRALIIDDVISEGASKREA